MFTKKHYEAIARVMQSTKVIDAAEPADLTRVDQWHADVHALTNLFARDRDAFDRDRFERACEPGANVRTRKVTKKEGLG